MPKGVPSDLTDNELLEAVQMLDELHNEHNYTWKRLSQAMGYLSRNAANKIHSLDMKPSREAFERLRDLHAAGKPKAKPRTPAAQAVATRVPPRVPADQQAERTPIACQSRRTVLDDLDDARKSLDRAIGDVQRASETSVPLLRPGLAQLAGKLEEARRWLEVA